MNVPSFELFETQDAGYRDHVLPPALSARVAIEAAHPMPWYRYVGPNGVALGIDRFGASAPYQEVYAELGLTADRVVQSVLRVLDDE